MNKQTIPAVLILAVSLMVIIGSQTFLAPCIHEDGTFGPCHWAGQMLLGLGCALGVLAVLAFCMPRARMGIYLGILPVCVLGILTPGTLIDLCRMSTMRCRMVMQPAAVILSAACFVCAVFGAALSAGRGKR